MVPLTEFLHSPSAISPKYQFISPWWLLSWGFHQLVVLSPFEKSEKLQEGRFVILTNVEVSYCAWSENYGTDILHRILPKRFYTERPIKVAMWIKFTPSTCFALKLQMLSI